MNLTLCYQSLRESCLFLAGCCMMLFSFMWLFVWIVKQVPVDRFVGLLRFFKGLVDVLPISLDELSSRPAQVALGYVDPVVIVVLAAWAITRGSDAVSGQLERGSLEMLLAQPVRRMTLLASQAVVTIFGAALLAASAWAGTATGLALAMSDDPIAPERFYPAAANLFAFAFCLSGLTTAASAWGRYRWKSIGLICTLLIVQKIIEIVAKAVKPYAWIERLTFFTLYRPAKLVIDPENAWPLAWQYCGALVAIGLAGYLLAAIVFHRRDLPAPL